MNDSQKRLYLFLFGCIGTRLLLTYAAANVSKNILVYMGYLALLPAFGFSIIYAFGLRKTGPEVFGEKIWWNNIRPIHALLYFTFAYLAINKCSNAWKVLLLDVMIGLASFLNNRYWKIVKI